MAEGRRRRRSSGRGGPACRSEPRSRPPPSTAARRTGPGGRRWAARTARPARRRRRSVPKRSGPWPEPAALPRMMSPQASVRLSRSTTPTPNGRVRRVGKRCRIGLLPCQMLSDASDASDVSSAGTVVASRDADRSRSSSLRRRTAPTEGLWPTSTGSDDAAVGAGGVAATRGRLGYERSRKGGGTGRRALEHADAVGERFHSRVEIRPDGADEGDLEHDLRVGCLADVHQPVAEDLHGADDPRQSHRLGQAHVALACRARRRAELGGQPGEEDLAQVVGQLRRQLLGPPAAGQQGTDGNEHACHVGGGQRVDHLGQLRSGRVGRARRHHLVQRRQCVPGGPSARAGRLPPAHPPRGRAQPPR